MKKIVRSTPKKPEAPKARPIIWIERNEAEEQSAVIKKSSKSTK